MTPSSQSSGSLKTRSLEPGTGFSSTAARRHRSGLIRPLQTLGLSWSGASEPDTSGARSPHCSQNPSR